MEKVKKNKKIIIPIILVVLVILLGLTYAWFVWKDTGNQHVRIAGGTLDLVLDETSQKGIGRLLDIPKSDDQGYATDAYTFSVINNSNVDINYELSLEDLDLTGLDWYNGEERISDSDLKYVLLKNGEEFYTTADIEFALPGENNTFNGTYDYESNSLTYAGVNGSELSGFANHINPSIQNSNESTAENACDILKSSFSVTGSCTIKKHNKSALLSDASSRKIYTGSISSGDTDSFSLRVWIQSEADENAMNKVFYARLKLNGTQKDTSLEPNPNIKAVYPYEESDTYTTLFGTEYPGCLGGMEANCVDTLVNVTSKTTYPVGTIIKYEVADGVEKYFNVLHDNGKTLTLQQRENMVYGVTFYSECTSGSELKGPLTALSSLDNATSSWTNVNNISYSIGDSSSSLGFSLCTSYNDCSGTTYKLTRNNVKARMITVQESTALGCTENSGNESCPKFMNNYLSRSTSSQASYNDTTTFDGNSNNGYWTMNAADSTTGVWRFVTGGAIEANSQCGSNTGARAVVEINK